MKIQIGQPDVEHIIIEVQAEPDPRDEHGWLNCEITVSAGSWTGIYPADLRTPDFPSFRKQLESLLHDLTATAVFETLEGQIRLRLKGDRRGHITVCGTARDKVGDGNKLEFEFEIDQSYLPEIISDLQVIEQHFPAHGLK